MGQPSAQTMHDLGAADSAPAAARPARGGFRPDIQGLRAIAVTLVVVTHLWGWPTGGFVGVDVFFVISGYLITGLLLRELERTGRISMRGFYARRMRRIFPMAVVVLVCTVVAAYALFAASRAHSTFVDAIWAFLFVENWQLVFNGTDYFHAGAAISPVRQYWSLSVEEQFYLVWPLFMLALGALAMRHRRRRGSHAESPMSGRLPTVLGTVIAVVVLASFGWAVVRSGEYHAEAYFSTFTRIWELGVGALLAIVVGLGGAAAGSPRVRGWLVALGLALIAGSALLLTEDSRFPGPWAAVPVLGAALMLAFGARAAGPASGLLRTRVFQYTGQVSYSWYLWHFPVFIFLFAVVQRTALTTLAAFALSFALAAFSNYFIEEPVRHSRWLSGGAATRKESSGGAPRWLRVAVLSGSAAAVLVVGVTSIYPRIAAPSQQAAAPASLTDLAAPAAGEGAAEQPAAAGAGSAVQPAAAQVDPLATLHNAVAAAAAATEWPELDLRENWRDYGATVRVPECTHGKGDTVECDFRTPGATKNMVVFGDSQVLAWLPGLRDAATKAGYNVHVLNMPGCAVADVPLALIFSPEQPYPECADFRHKAMDYVQQHRPDLTVATSVWTWKALREDQRNDDEAAINWSDGITVTLESFASASGRVVLLDSPPLGLSVGDCQTALSTPADCLTHPAAEYFEASELNQRAVDAARAATGKEIKHVTVDDWFCAPDAGCPSFVANQPVYGDGLHIAPGFGQFVSPLLSQQIFS